MPEYKETRLIFEDKEINSHKYYYMFVDSAKSTTFTVKYGRVGSRGTTIKYPIEKFNSKFNEKLKKGYQIVGTVTLPDGLLAQIEKELGL